mgnify:CR=1 FL=1
MTYKAPRGACNSCGVPHSQGRLERLLRAGTFTVTAETTPPVSADPSTLLKATESLAGLADAVNVTDGAGAKSHMASLAAASLLVQVGIEPVLQFTVRDRNRIALQNDLLGAAALGIPNILCLTKFISGYLILVSEIN